VLERKLEAIPGRRLQRIILGDGAIEFPDERLYDTATRSDCARYRFDDVTRCIPADVANGMRLFRNGCQVPADVAEVSERSCARPAFATMTTDAFEIRAIGEPVTDALFAFAGLGCEFYAPPPDVFLHAVGPPIDPKSFMGAIYFGER